MNWKYRLFMSTLSLHSAVAKKYNMKLELSPAVTAQISDIPIEYVLFDSYEQYYAYRKLNSSLISWRTETALEIGDKSQSFSGYCPVCKKKVMFFISNYHTISFRGKDHPNLRETVCCAECGLNVRLRGCMALVERLVGKDDSIYITEQVTQLYRVLCERYPNVVGSEFLSTEVKLGEKNKDGIRNEDVTNLTFENDSKDAILTFDVFEHVSDYKKGFRECHRILSPGGHLIMTVPLFDTIPTQVIATLQSDGTINYLTEPEYHGNPLTAEGSLCFNHFGWDILDELKSCGFKDAKIASYWSVENGIFSIGDQHVIIAQK